MADGISTDELPVKFDLLTANPVYKPFRYPWAYDAWLTQQRIHWLPEEAAGRAYDLAGKGWARENRLLRGSDLRRLFPGPVKIVNLGMTLVAIT
jgi:hypothetical protein